MFKTNKRLLAEIERMKAIKEEDYDTVSHLRGKLVLRNREIRKMNEGLGGLHEQIIAKDDEIAMLESCARRDKIEIGELSRRATYANDNIVNSEKLNEQIQDQADTITGYSEMVEDLENEVDTLLRRLEGNAPTKDLTTYKITYKEGSTVTVEAETFKISDGAIFTFTIDGKAELVAVSPICVVKVVE